MSPVGGWSSEDWPVSAGGWWRGVGVGGFYGPPPSWQRPGYETFESNARLVPWPSVGDLLREFLELNAYPRMSGDDSSYPRALLWALDAAISRISERTGFPVRVPSPPVEWRVRTFAGLATILGTGVFTEDRVGATITGTGVPPGTTLELVAAPDSAYLSQVALYTTDDVGTVVCVGAGVADPDTPALIPPHVFYPTLLQAARWFKRRQAVEGVIGASELGGVIRTSSLDPDIESMLANDLLYGLA
jgi:hypothetical protein